MIIDVLALVLTDLQNRGCRHPHRLCGGLKGFPEAIASIAQNEVQTCIVHKIRNSLKYVGSKHQKDFMKELETGLSSRHKELALKNLDALSDKWSEKWLSSIRGKITGQRFPKTSNIHSRSEKSSTRRTLLRTFIAKCVK